MKLNEAIEVLINSKYIGSDEYASYYDREINEAIDTVVAEVEKPLACNNCTDKNGQNIGNMYVCNHCGRQVD